MNIPVAANFAPYADTLLARGFCVLPSVLSDTECQDFIDQYDREQRYRSVVDMERYSFGSGQYRYFDWPLPENISRLRRQFYELLVPSAAQWSERLRSDMRFPASFAEYEAGQKRRNQTTPTPLILRYRAGDYNCLHQDIAAEHYFPYQIIIALSRRGRDFDGGELVLTQQRPRMQTIPHIVQPERGDCVIIASRYQPCPGKRGYYRTTFRHGVARITNGERYSLGVIFHNYGGEPTGSAK